MKFLKIKIDKIKTKSAFTLVELILVMTIITMLSAISLTSLLSTQATFQFKSTSEQVFGMMREARSLAVTGKAQIDYTDFDEDGCKAGTVEYKHDPACTEKTVPDYVTPANYGIYFDTENRKIIMFADMHGSNIGKFDKPAAVGKYEDTKDLILSEYSLPPNYKFFIYPKLTTTVMFSPIFADTTFETDLSPSQFFWVFGIEENKGFRKSCMAIQRVAGNIEDFNKIGNIGVSCGETDNP